MGLAHGIAGSLLALTDTLRKGKVTIEKENRDILYQTVHLYSFFFNLVKIIKYMENMQYGLINYILKIKELNIIFKIV